MCGLLNFRLLLLLQPPSHNVVFSLGLLVSSLSNVSHPSTQPHCHTVPQRSSSLTLPAAYRYAENSNIDNKHQGCLRGSRSHY